MAGWVLLLPPMAFAVDLPKTGLAETNGAVTVGKPAPPLDGTDIKGRVVAAESFKGRPVLVDFSSIFCSSCQERADVVQLVETLRERLLRSFVTVDPGRTRITREDVHAAIQFAADTLAHEEVVFRPTGTER